MIPNPIPYLTKKLVKFSTKPMDYDDNESSIPYFRRYGELLHFHTECFGGFGDVSIAASCANWQHFCRRNQLKLRLVGDPEAKVLFNDESIEQLLEESKNWLFPLLSVIETPKERYALRFQRKPIVHHVINSIIEQGADYGKHKIKDSQNGRIISISLEAADGDELHHFRQRQLYDIFLRMIDYSDWRIIETDDKPDDKTLFLRIESQRPKEQEKNHVSLVCGGVYEPGRRTPTNLTSGSYKALRSNDMLLIAMHRHGIRGARRNSRDGMLMQRLGNAAVVVDLFEVRHTTTATVVRNGSGCCKGAAYILYNSARLETLLRNFNKQVDEGVYPPLPPLNEIDLSLLEDDIDWQLIYGYLFAFPQMMESSVIQSEQGQCCVHSLVYFIVSMASQFSRYYRNKQVLTQSRDQLLPVLYARIYLIKAVREVLNAALAILGIQPVDYM